MNDRSYQGHAHWVTPNVNGDGLAAYMRSRTRKVSWWNYATSGARWCNRRRAASRYG